MFLPQGQDETRKGRGAKVGTWSGAMLRSSEGTARRTARQRSDVEESSGFLPTRDSHPYRDRADDAPPRRRRSRASDADFSVCGPPSGRHLRGRALPTGTPLLSRARSPGRFASCGSTGLRPSPTGGRTGRACSPDTTRPPAFPHDTPSPADRRRHGVGGATAFASAGDRIRRRSRRPATEDGAPETATAAPPGGRGRRTTLHGSVPVAIRLPRRRLRSPLRGCARRRRRARSRRCRRR